jgi:hypothetical protein
MKKPALRAGAGWIGSLVGWSVGSAALESLKHQIAHRPDIGLDAFQPIGIVVAVLGPLAIGAVVLATTKDEAADKVLVDAGGADVRLRDGLSRLAEALCNWQAGAH